MYFLKSYQEGFLIDFMCWCTPVCFLPTFSASAEQPGPRVTSLNTEMLFFWKCCYSSEAMFRLQACVTWRPVPSLWACLSLNAHIAVITIMGMVVRKAEFHSRGAAEPHTCFSSSDLSETGPVFS